MSDLKENLHTDHMVLNMGPSHPATHGTVKFLLTLDGETVVDMTVEVGYLHRGFEKMCESVTYSNVFPYTDPFELLFSNHEQYWLRSGSRKVV